MPRLRSLDHVTRRFAHGEEHAVQIDALHSAKIFDRDVEHILRADPDAGIGDGRIEPSEIGNDLLDARLHCVFVGDVYFRGRSLSAPFLQTLERCFVLAFVGAPDDDAGALPGEALGHADPDAAIAARDQCYFSRQIEQRFHWGFLALACPKRRTKTGRIKPFSAVDFAGAVW